MLHLTIICIVCAISALSEGDILTRLKYNRSNVFCHFSEGIQNLKKPSLPQMYNVNQSFSCCKGNLSNKTGSFFYDNIFRQYQFNSNYSSCSLKNFFSEEIKKNFNSNIALKTRNLLWFDESEKKKNNLKFLMNTNKNSLNNLPFSRRSINEIIGQKKGKHKREKRRFLEKTLDNIPVIEDLDIDKSIEKLVKSIAHENNSTINNFVGSSVTDSIKDKQPTNESDNEINMKLMSRTKIEKKFPLSKKVKRLIRLGENYINFKKNGKVALGNGKLGRSSIAKESTQFNTYNIKDLEYKKRSRRHSGENFIPNYLYNRYNNYQVTNNKKTRDVLSEPNGANILKNDFYSQNSKNLNLKEQKIKINSRPRRTHSIFKTKSIPRRHLTNKREKLSSRLERCDAITQKPYGNIGIMKTNKVLSSSNSNKFLKNKNNGYSICKNSKMCPNDDSGNLITKNQENPKTDTKNMFNYHPKISTKVGRSMEKNSDYSSSEYSKNSNFRKELSKKLLREQINRFSLKRKRNKSPRSQKIFTEFPFLQSPKSTYRRNFKYKRYNSKDLSTDRYLTIRHALRNYLIQNNIWKPSKRALNMDRRKRCEKCQSMHHKCWRSAPLLCIPYIRRGQDELLKYLIKSMQKMLGKPFPQKVDIFEKTKFKPARKNPETCEDVIPNTGDNETTTNSTNETAFTMNYASSTANPCFSTNLPKDVRVFPLPMSVPGNYNVVDSGCSTYSSTCLPAYSTTYSPIYASSYSPNFASSFSPNYLPSYRLTLGTASPCPTSTICPTTTTYHTTPTCFTPPICSTTPVCSTTPICSTPPICSTTCAMTSTCPTFTTCSTAPTMTSTISTTTSTTPTTTFTTSTKTSTTTSTTSSTISTTCPTTTCATTTCPTTTSTCPTTTTCATTTTSTCPTTTTCATSTCPTSTCASTTSTCPTTTPCPPTSTCPTTTPCPSTTRCPSTTPCPPTSTCPPTITCPTATTCRTTTCSSVTSGGPVSFPTSFSTIFPTTFRNYLANISTNFPPTHFTATTSPTTPSFRATILSPATAITTTFRTTTAIPMITTFRPLTSSYPTTICTPASSAAPCTSSTIYPKPSSCATPTKCFMVTCSNKNLPGTTVSPTTTCPCPKEDRTTFPVLEPISVLPRTNLPTSTVQTTVSFTQFPTIQSPPQVSLAIPTRPIPTLQIRSSTFSYNNSHNSNLNGSSWYYQDIPMEQLENLRLTTISNPPLDPIKPLSPQAPQTIAHALPNPFSIPNQVMTPNPSELAKPAWQSIIENTSPAPGISPVSGMEFLDFGARDAKTPLVYFKKPQAEKYPKFDKLNVKNTNPGKISRFRKTSRDEDEMKYFAPYKGSVEPLVYRSDKFFSRMPKNRRHKGSFQTKQLPHMGFPSAYGYTNFDKMPYMKPHKNSHLKFTKSPWIFDKKFNEKIKHQRKRRQKRGDNYYLRPDNTENDLEYFDEPNYDVEYPEDFTIFRSNSKKNLHPGSLENAIFGRKPKEPPTYDMFQELANAVRENMSISDEDNTETTESSVEMSTVNITLEGSTIVGNSTTANTTSTKVSNTTESIAPLLGGSTPKNASVVAGNVTGEVLNVTTANSVSDGSTNAPKMATTIKPTTEVSCLVTHFSDVEKKAPAISLEKNIIPPSAGTERVGAQTGMKHYQAFDSTNSKKEKINKDGDEDQLLTTLGNANMVKGPKKSAAKPTPKTYVKVFPDSLPNEMDSNDEDVSNTETTTPMQSVDGPDIRLQLLAICEGYLEVMKLIKTQNQSLGEELDSDLSRYCENIISQSFNLPSDSASKSKKIESTSLSRKSCKTSKKNFNKFDFISNNYPLGKESDDHKLENKIVIGVVSNPVYKRELETREKSQLTDINNNNKTNVGSKQITSDKNKDYLNAEQEKGSFQSLSSDVGLNDENQGSYNRKDDLDEKLLKSNLPEEQVKILHLLKKRKKALLSWLFNSKDKLQPGLTQEKEYPEVNEYESEHPSGTITFRGDQETPKTSTNKSIFLNESFSVLFPVYAKQYGYDQGGELREIEILWRNINEKTHEQKLLKNLSVLALFLTSTTTSYTSLEESLHIGNRGRETEEIADSNNEELANLIDDTKSASNATTVPPALNTTNTTIASNTTNVKLTNLTTTEPPFNKTNANLTTTAFNATTTETPSNLTTSQSFHTNVTRKISHKLDAAKGLFQEYMIEFLNYAVYILPIMFTLLFLFCCVCCFFQYLNKRKKKRKKKKKKNFSTDDDTENSELSESEKKKRKNKHKRNSKDDMDAENLEKKNIWSVLKLNSNSKEETRPPENKKNFLRFLKGKKDNDKVDDSTIPYTSLNESERSKDDSPKRRDSESKKNMGHISYKARHRDREDPNEATERRELIALLEELKRMETEKFDERRDQRSVQVQYMTHTSENMTRIPYCYGPGKPQKYYDVNKQFPFYEENAKDFPNCDEYEGMEEEMTELIPSQNSYFGIKNDHVRHPDFGSFFKIFRNSAVSYPRSLGETNFLKRDRNSDYNKYKNISTETSDETIQRSRKHTDVKADLTGNVFDSFQAFGLPSRRKAGIVDRTESQLYKKKYVRLKDDGVLCRL